MSGSLNLKCVVVLGSEGLLGPGAVVDYPANATQQTRVPLPNADLFSTTCLIPGEQINALLESLRQQKEKNTVSIAEMTYSLNRSFHLGVELPIPQLANLTLKAGPNAKDVTDITLKVPRAWVKLIDEFRFAEIRAQIETLQLQVKATELLVLEKLKDGVKVAPGLLTARVKEFSRRNVAWKEVVVREQGQEYAGRVLNATKPKVYTSLVVELK